LDLKITPEKTKEAYMKKMVRLLCCSLPLIILAACGGGGGGSSAATNSGSAAPLVVSVTPFDGATGISAKSTADPTKGTPITVVFSNAMDPTSIVASTGSLGPPTVFGPLPVTTPTNGTLRVSYVAPTFTTKTAFGNLTTVYNKRFIVSGTVTADASNKVFTFTPAAPLTALDGVTGLPLNSQAGGSGDAARTFEVNIKSGPTGVKKADGTPMVNGTDVISSFTIWAGTQQTQTSTLYNDVASGVGTDADGNIYLAGYTYGSLGSGPNGTNQDTGHTADILLAKYDSNGAFQWNQQLGSPFNDQVTGFTVDSSSGSPQLIAVGYTDGTLPFVAVGRANPDTTGATHNYFVAKFIEGNPQPWTVTQSGTLVKSSAFAVASDINGNIYVAGETYGDLPTAGGSTATYQGGGTTSDIFVAKYDKNLNLVWTKVFGSAGNERATGIAVDTNSSDLGHPNVYITGWTDGNLFATNKGGKDVFVAKLDNSGTLLSSSSGNFNPVQFGTAGDDHALAITVDSSGYPTVVGGTSGSLYATNQGLNDIFVIAFDTIGNVRWKRQIGTSGDDEAFGVTTDNSRNVYVTGTTAGSLFGIGQGGGDVFAVKCDFLTGATVWSNQLGTSQSDVGMAAAFFSGPGGTLQNPTGYLYLAGYTFGDLDGNFNQSGGRFSTNGNGYNTSDIFLVKYNSATGLKY
jgi:hypothetical protein